jgi:GLPGLI family protein
MKKIITVFALLLMTSMNAQTFTGKATYKTSRKSDIQIDANQEGMTDKIQEEVQKRLQKMSQKTFILEFDKTKSVYKQDESLAAPNLSSDFTQVQVIEIGGGSGKGSIYYKDLQGKIYRNQTEIQGKVFLIKDDLPAYDWKMSTETKNIGMYTCYKATYSKEVEQKQVTFINGEMKEEVVKETIVTTAWYTLQVPVSNGPDNYQGLPGLILEINDGKNLIVCTEISMNPSKSIKIEAPKKGKVVSQEKYDEIQNKKSKEMMEKFKSRRGFEMNGMDFKMGN